MLVGLAWLGAAGFTAYLAYQQWSYGTLLDSSDLKTTAGWNAVSGAITLYFGARVIASPSRVVLERSVVWAALSVVLGVVQVGNPGGVGDTFVLALIASAVAGVLSFVGRQQFPEPEAEPAIAPTVASLDPLPATAAPPALAAAAALGVPEAPRRLPLAEILVGLLIVGALGGGAYLLLNRPAASATAQPTVRPTTTPRPATPAPAGEFVVGFGDPVDLVDGDDNPLGSTTVLEARTPELILGFAAAEGNRFVIAKVRYKAEASWPYNVFDWAAHDGSGRQFEPLGYGPEPALNFGTLAPGRSTDGWVAFEIPTSSRDLWLDLQAFDGTVIFSVKID